MVKEVESKDLKQALELVNSVFSEFVAVEYSEQGKNTFENYLKNKYEEISLDLKSGDKKIWAYYEKGEILGVISTRETSHISLLFVDKKHHKKGIAKQMLNFLLEELKKYPNIDKITVHSSPYAVGVYEHLGFVQTGIKQEKDGIIFVPMMHPL